MIKQEVFKNTAIISLGSNCGDKVSNVKTALEWLRSQNDIILLSSSHVYETPEIHGRSITYMNAVAEISFNRDSDIVNAELKKYEVLSGRSDECRKSGMVPIDIDIVVLNGKVLRPQDFNSHFFIIGYNEIKG